MTLPAGAISGTAYGVSANGSVIVGDSFDGTNELATRWVDGTPAILGTLGGDYSRARSVSADGSVVVGRADIVGNAGHAFRWTQGGGMVDLGTLGGGYSDAFAVSGDGSVVVGEAASSATVREAFRWTQGGGMVKLGGVLPGAAMPASGSVSTAYGVSYDGSVIVGVALNAGSTDEAFRWTQSGGMVGLNWLPGTTQSRAYAVSADGTTVVGASDNGYLTNSKAFRWTETTGMQSVEAWLQSANPSFALAPGDTLAEASGVSASGKIVSGWGTLNGVDQPWIARIGEETGGSYSGLLGMSDFYSSLSDVRQVGAMGNSHIGSFMGNTLTVGRFAGRRAYVAPAAGESVYHRLTVSVQADLQVYDRDAIDGNQGSGSMMVAYAPSSDWRLGVGYAYGVLSVSQDERSGIKDTTHTRLPHHTLGLFAQYGEALGWQARAAFAYGWGDPRIKRSYYNGGQSVTSSGDSSVDMMGVEAEGGYTFDVAPNVSLQPYAGLGWVRSSMDAYSESGGTGTFPARFDKRTDSEWRGRVGLDGLWQVAPSVGLTSGVSYTRQFGGSSDNVAGAMSGLFDFSAPVSDADSGWTTLNVGTRIDLNAQTLLGLGAGVNVGSNEAEPSYFFSARVTMGF